MSDSTDNNIHIYKKDTERSDVREWILLPGGYASTRDALADLDAGAHGEGTFTIAHHRYEDVVIEPVKEPAFTRRGAKQVGGKRASKPAAATSGATS